MIWGTGDVEATLTGNSGWVMGFNEPDRLDQSNMTVTQVVQNWHRIEERFPAPTYKLLAPAYSQDAYGSTNPIADMRQAFYDAYGYYPRLDGLAVHCYMPFATDCENFITTNFINRMSEFGASEIWVTEFSSNVLQCGSESGAWAQGGALIDWMQQQPQITHFAWFAARIRCYNDPSNCEPWVPLPGNTANSPLFNWADGTPTYYGTQYTLK